MEVKLAERGQIVIPKKARDKLGLSPGTKMEVKVERGQLILRKIITLDLSNYRHNSQTNIRRFYSSSSTLLKYFF